MPSAGLADRSRGHWLFGCSGSAAGTVWCRITTLNLHSYDEPAHVFMLCATGPHSSPQLVTHPHYNRSTNNADIMLIKLRAPMVLNKYVSLAPLPRQGTGVFEGLVCRVSGWGYNNLDGGQAPFTLRTVTVPIVSSARCNSSESFNGNITANMICAGYRTGGKDACKGDSGGPLVCRGCVYGVVSWGNGCGDAKFPGVYTAVSKFRRWIDQTIYGSYLRCTKY
ncbi:trypsin-3-like isoform X3 [Perca fluviatilis]|uniref:trypsin-3-like isoform X3 n=1 Tax=Perca fluviatilis TaxID=8168 RepID=UPI0019631118|nr:trypsin-3-like isoform X3 [Perca fluviatilis]